MKKIKIIVAIIIAMAFIFAGFSAYASENETAKEVEKLNEIAEKRTLSSRAYQMSDGTTRHELFATDINYKDATGKLKPIDIKVKDIDSSKSGGYKFKNGENSWNVYFADIGKAQDMVKIEQDNYLISFSLNESKSTATASKSLNMEKGKSEFHDFYREDPTVVMYQDAMSDIDIAYTIRENYLKEDIILNKKPQSNQFTFTITTINLALVLKDNRLTYNDEMNGEQIFETDNLYMEDSKGNISEDVSLKLEKLGDNKYSLIVIADEKFLNDENTVYPVIIDPTIQNSSTYDVFVADGMPTTNMNSGSTRAPYLRTGKDTSYGIRRSYIKFRDSDIDNAVISGDTILSAYLDLCEYSHLGTIAIRAYLPLGSWTSSGVTWNNQPGYDSSSFATSSYYGSDWYRMNVTNWARDWEDGSITNNGLLVKAYYEGSTSVWTTFRSSDNWDSSRRPRLVMTTEGGWLGALDCFYSDENHIGIWNSTPLVYFEDLGDRPDPQDTEDEVEEAVSQWDDIIDVSTTTNPQYANIEYLVGDYDTLIEYDYFSDLPTSAAGATVPYVADGNGEGNWYYEGTSILGYEMTGARCCTVYDNSSYPQNVAIHEMGHALGWFGHSSVGSDIMYDTEHSAVTLTDRDKNQLDQLY